MRDYLNRFDPMPMQLGAVIRQKPEPTAEQKRIAAFREFEAMSDKLKAKGAANGDAMVGAKQPTEADSAGWIKWEGGECPVAPGTRIEVRMRKPDHDSMGYGFDFSNPEHSRFWEHELMGNDIVAYRLIQEPKKPEADADGWVKVRPADGMPQALRGKNVELLSENSAVLFRGGIRAEDIGWNKVSPFIAYRVIG